MLCETCGYDQDEDDFFKGHKVCKTCRGEYRKSVLQLGSEADRALITFLRSNGIYAAPGRFSEWTRAGVVAWGCIRIEPKISLYHNPPGKFVWNFQNRPLDVELICLIETGKGDDTIYHFLPAYHPMFFSSDGRRKLTINYVPEPRKRSMLSRYYAEHLDQAINNIKLIEELRRQYSG